MKTCTPYFNPLTGQWLVRCEHAETGERYELVCRDEAQAKHVAFVEARG